MKKFKPQLVNEKALGKLAGNPKAKNVVTANNHNNPDSKAGSSNFKDNDAKALEEFFSVICPLKNENQLEIRTFNDENKFFKKHSKAIKYIESKVESENIYFGVTPRKKGTKTGTKEDCDIAHCFWTEIDFKHEGNGVEAEVLERVKKFKRQPSCIIHSGNGVHLYWLVQEAIKLDSTSIPFVEMINKAIEKELNGDHVSNIDRILRVPFTKNVKDPNNHKEVKIIEMNDNRYSPEDFDFLGFSKINTTSSDWELEEVEESKILELIEYLPEGFKEKLFLNSNEDRSKMEFGLVLGLLKTFNWTPSQVYKAMHMKEFKNGLGKKTHEEGREEEYPNRTINSVLAVLEDEHILINTKEESVLTLLHQPFDNKRLDNIYYDESGKHYIELTNNNYRYLSTQEFKKLLETSMVKWNEEKEASLYNKNMETNYLQFINTSKVIKELETVPIPFGLAKTKIIKLVDGKYKLKSEISLLDHLKNKLSEFPDEEIPDEFINFMFEKYPEIIDIYLGGLARRNCGDKKSTVWFHCNSNYGKTFFFHIQGVTQKFDFEIKSEDLKGNEPAYFYKKVFFFVDEATRFTKEMKSDTIQYRALYSGLRQFAKGLTILASANPIRDLEGGIDEQLMTRVTKISPETKNLKETLSKIGLTPQTAKPIYDKFIITVLIEKLAEWEKEPNINYKILADGEFQLFLDNYKDNLDNSSLLELLTQEIESLVNENFTFKESKFHSNNNSECDFIKSSSDKLFIVQPQKFLEEVISRRIGQKKYALEKLGLSNKRLGEIYSEFKTNKIEFKSIKSIHIHYKIIDGMIKIIPENH